MTLFLLLACTSGTIKIEDSGAETDADTDVDSDTDTDADTDADTDTAPWTGDWSGTTFLSVTGPDGQPFTICEGDAELAVAYDASFTGSGTCTPPDAPGEANLDFAGSIAGDGAITGTVSQTSPEGTATEYELAGTATETALTFGWSGELHPPDRDEAMPFDGGFEGEKE